MTLHRRVFVLLLAAFPLAGLAGCDRITSTTTVRNVRDGAHDDRFWSRTWKDRARFRCIASSSGHCDIVVFVSICAGASCDTQLVKALALAAGASRTLGALPRGFKHCVAHDAKPVAPTCLKA